MIDFFEGILKITNMVLAIIAGYMAISMYKSSEKRRDLVAWKALIFALLFFAVHQILGALRAFNIFTTSYLTHINASVVLGFLIWALVMQIYSNRGEK